MKRSIKFYSVALAALMAFASLAFVSCDKENDVVNPQNERVTKSDVNDPYTFPIHEMNFTDQNNTMVNITPAFLGDESWNTLFTKKLRNWVNGCLKGTELDASCYDGINVQRILNGVYDSAAAGKEVAIK